MEYFHVEDSSNFPVLSGNGSQQQHGFMQDVTNMAPRPSKRPQAHMGGSAPMQRTTSPSRDRSSSADPQQQHIFSAAAPAWHPPSSTDADSTDGSMPPPPPPGSQQNLTPENIQVMSQMMTQMEALMSQFVQFFPNGAPPAQERQHAISMQRMFDQVKQLQQQGGGALPPSAMSNEEQMAIENAFYRGDAHRPVRRPTAVADLHQSDMMMPLHQQPMTMMPAQQQRMLHHQQHGFHPRGGRASSGYKHIPQSNPNQPQIIALVEFKRQRMKKFECDLFISPGHYVIVEGDRGLDCGFVIHCCIRNPDGSLTRQESIDNAQFDINRIKSEPGRVVRLASKEEVDLLHGDIASEERVALKTCREIAVRLNLNMDIVDCEYQFDRNKVSFYFEAPHSIDFRELNTELFRIFGVRIWLENLNSKVKNVVPDGAMSHADKMQFTKNGLRPPRRT